MPNKPTNFCYFDEMPFMIKRNICGLLLLIFLSVPAFAQKTIKPVSQNQFKTYEDSLKKLGQQFVNNENDLERKNANYQFIKSLVTALRLPDSYHYHFDSVKTVSIAYAPDDKFRIFTWNVMNQDGSYRFYGTIQMNTAEELKMFPLTDYSPFVKNPEDTILTPKEWLGAEYYKIIKTDGENTYYVLLGWKGNTVKTTKKVIDVLSFKNNAPVFGLPVFEGGVKTRDRIVFEYARQVSMMLKYIPKRHLIVFDHLAPPDPKLKGNYNLYGPDLTYDGYQLKKGKWVLTENLDMRNVAEDRDANFVDPKKQIRDSIANLHKKPTSSLPTTNHHKKS